MKIYLLEQNHLRRISPKTEQNTPRNTANDVTSSTLGDLSNRLTNQMQDLWVDRNSAIQRIFHNSAKPIIYSISHPGKRKQNELEAKQLANQLTRKNWNRLNKSELENLKCNLSIMQELHPLTFTDTHKKLSLIINSKIKQLSNKK
jgi:hypothetical protein